MLFVTIDKHPGFADLQQDYADEVTSSTTMNWESQNMTRIESNNGQIIIEKEQGYRKLMFVRLRSKDKNYGSAFFYLGEVTLENYQGEKPIKVVWNFQQAISEPIYHYLSDKKHRKYDIKEPTFVDEYSVYS